LGERLEPYLSKTFIPLIGIASTTDALVNVEVTSIGKILPVLELVFGANDEAGVEIEEETDVTDRDDCDSDTGAGANTLPVGLGGSGAPEMDPPPP
jgi:hypothetical protein